ncbi:MAG: LicD family protein [Bacteroides sp.]|nr:LicD family protein [Prevotella sp.]MCM1407872.1 LicD family protein [Treponema brennaborense]MCM1469614.1 LicD family protein [Bacteroides sp.]
MKEIFIEDIRRIQLEMLDYFDDLCRKNNLRYSLSGGTLLGAVRHKGYIPWDDDIDVFMPRKDYEQFLLAADKSEQNYYKIFSPFNNEFYYYPFSKLVDVRTKIDENHDRPLPQIGIYIDIFPIDGLPNNEKKRKNYWNRIRKIKRVCTMVYQKKAHGENMLKQIFRYVMFFLLKLVKANTIAKFLNTISSCYEIEKSDYAAVSLFGYGEKEQMPVSVLSDFSELQFEGKMYKVIKNYDLYLSNLYGDYMKLPPENQRQMKHGFSAYYI